MGARFIILPTCRVCVKFLLFSVALACDAHHSKGKQSLLMALPPALLFGGLAYKLRPRSFKSWRWRFASWRLFTPRQKKGRLLVIIIQGPLVVAFRSSLMKALDRSVETLGLWIVISSVTFIKSINSARAPLNLDDGGLLPDAYLHLVRKKAAC